MQINNSNKLLYAVIRHSRTKQEKYVSLDSVVVSDTALFYLDIGDSNPAFVFSTQPLTLR